MAAVRQADPLSRTGAVFLSNSLSRRFPPASCRRITACKKRRSKALLESRLWFWLRGGLGSDTRACACSLNPFYLNPFYVNPFYGAGFRPESPSGSFATAEPAMPGAPLQQSLEAA